MVLRVGLVLELADLGFYCKFFSGVVDGAVLVVVVADGAVEIVIVQNAVEGVTLCNVGAVGAREHDLSGSDAGLAGADEFAVELDHAGVAGADVAHRLEVADLRHADAAVRGGGAIDGLDERLAAFGCDALTVDLDGRIRRQDDRSIEQRLRVILGTVHNR
jgi:hypothetical protein